MRKTQGLKICFLKVELFEIEDLVMWVTLQKGNDQKLPSSMLTYTFNHLADAMTSAMTSLS